MSRRCSRREFVAASAAGLCVSGTGLVEAAEGKEPGQPNILVIHVDQHRADCLGTYGNVDIRTPHVDALAADGVRFDRSFCPYPVCTPSRYSLLSGQYVHEHEGWSNHCTLRAEIDTFPKILRRAGYRTKAVGKMHFAPTYLDVGFDEMELAEQDGPGRWDDDYHRYLRDQGLVDRNDLEDQRREYRKGAPREYWDTFGALPSNLPEKHHSTTWIADRAMATLEGWDKGGHLLMVGFVKPHHPFDPPKEWCNAYDPDSLSILPGWTDACLPHDLERSKGYFPHEDLTPEALRRVMAYYYATIEQIDHHVGRMVAVLKERGLYDDTVIVFTSDHGEYMGHHHMLLKSNFMYDPLTRVPLIIKYPRQQQKGTSSDALVSNVDVAPTLVKLTGCRPADSMHGNDLADPDSGRDIVFAESGKDEVMARTKRHKLILMPARKLRLFYDLEADPHELENRCEDPAYAGEVQRLTKALEGWRPLDLRAKAYLDENAPVIDAPNVPSRADDHRASIEDYYKRKMREAQQG